MCFETESYWVCPNCQAQVPSDCDTCPECGYSEAVDDLEEQRRGYKNARRKTS